MTTSREASSVKEEAAVTG